MDPDQLNFLHGFHGYTQVKHGKCKEMLCILNPLGRLQGKGPKTAFFSETFNIAYQIERHFTIFLASPDFKSAKNFCKQFAPRSGRT